MEGSDCCVRLELLVPVSDGCEVSIPPLDPLSAVCPFFPIDDPVTDFQATVMC